MTVRVAGASLAALLVLGACARGSDTELSGGTAAPDASIQGVGSAEPKAETTPGGGLAQVLPMTSTPRPHHPDVPGVDLTGLAPTGAVLRGKRLADWSYFDPLRRPLEVFAFDLDDAAGAMLVDVSPPGRLLWSTLQVDAGADGDAASSVPPPPSPTTIRAVEITDLGGGSPLPGILAGNAEDLLLHRLDIIDLSADPVSSRSLWVSAGQLSDATRFGAVFEPGAALGLTTETPILEVRTPGRPDRVLFYPAPSAPSGPGTPLRSTAAATGRTVFVDIEADGRFEAVTKTSGDKWRVFSASTGVWNEGPEVSDVVPDPPPALGEAATLPPLPADLYFTRGREVVRWPSRGGALETVLPQSSEAALAPVESRTTGAVPRRPFRVAADGSRLVALVSPVAEDDESEAQFMSLDLTTGGTTLLPVRGGIGLEWGTARDWVLTPDGLWVVYVGLGIAPPDVVVTPAPYAGSPPGYGTVIAQSTVDPDVFEEVAWCGTFDAGPEHGIAHCSADVSVSPDGARVAFSDGEGLRVAALPGHAGAGAPVGGSGEMIVPHHYGEYEAAVTIRTPGDWSPDGRLLLAREGGYEGSSMALVDLAAHTAQSLENTWEYSGPVSSLAWAQDSGSVVHARAHDGRYPFGQYPLTRISAANPDQVQSLLPVVNLGSAQLAAYEPATLPDASVYFVLRGPPGGYRDNGLFVIPAGTNVWQRLHTLPPDEPDDEGYPPNTEVLWADGAAAFLATDSDPEWDPLAAGERVFVGAPEDEAWEASEVLEGGWWFAWGPPGQG